METVSFSRLLTPIPQNGSHIWVLRLHLNEQPLFSTLMANEGLFSTHLHTCPSNLLQSCSTPLQVLINI